MRIIPTGIDIKKFERPDITEQMKEDLREELGLTKENMMLLSLSRISYEKNIQAIIQGLPIIFERFPNARFVIVGDGPYVEKLSCLAEDLNIREKIQFVGEVPNDQVAIYYKAADYFVSASTSETQGLTYTEAMASGVPCVVEGNAYLNNLFDHESLGHTFESDDEFASAFIAYVESGIKPDETILKEKLYEISASYFGNRMFEFYEDMIKYYDQRLVEKEAAASIERIKVKFTSLRK